MLLSFLLPPAPLPPFVSKREIGAESHSFRLQEISPAFLGWYDTDFLPLN